MKRIFGLILSFMIGVTLLPACGSPAATHSEVNVNQTPTPTGISIPGNTSKNGNFSLQVTMDGSLTQPDGTISYGPNTAMIPLTLTGNTYQGSYEGVFNAKVTGKCNGAATYPVTFIITAIGTNELDFSVKTSIGMTMTGSCGSGSGGSVKMPPATATRTFTLPAKDGAAKVYETSLGGSGKITITFTLKKR